MLKKILSIVLLFPYLTGMVGVNVQMHYCKGNMVDISIFSKSDHCETHLGSCEFKSGSESSCCNTVKTPVSQEEDCCDDLEHHFRLEIPQNKGQLVSWSFSDFDTEILFVDKMVSIELENLSANNISSSFLKKPPPTPPQPRWLRFCAPLYYG